MSIESKIEIIRKQAQQFCEPHGNISVLAGEANVGITVVSRFVKGHTTPDSENLDKIEAALNRLLPGKPAPDKYEWLRRINVRDLGIIPPEKRPSKKAASGAVFMDEEQEPYTLTETQVEVIKAMIERRYWDAFNIIQDVLQGKRKDE